MPYKLHPITEITVQPGYNDLIRSKKEVAANAIEVAEFMQAQGDARELFPIRYVVQDGQKFTRNHATLAAAHLRGWDTILAIESPHKAGSTEDYLDLLLSNNQGHPISRLAQGQLFKRLRDGIPAEDSTDEAPKWIKEPMTCKEIGEACKPTEFTGQHVGDCITLVESSPEVRELMEAELVSANIVITAKQWAKDDNAKQLKILKHAVRVAKEEGAAKATKKHMDAIKAEYVKLKAAPVEGAEPEKKPKAKAKDADNNAQEGTEDENKGDTQETPSNPEAENLFSQAESELLTEGSKKNEKLKKALATRFLDSDALEKIGVTMSLTNEEADALAEDVVAIVANAREVF